MAAAWLHLAETSSGPAFKASFPLQKDEEELPEAWARGGYGNGLGWSNEDDSVGIALGPAPSASRPEEEGLGRASLSGLGEYEV